MPTYQYKCTDCGTPLEAVQSFTDDALTTCPTCGGTLRKVFSAVGVVFKGSGFYRTDSRDSGKVKAGVTAGDSGSSSAGSESGDKGKAADASKDGSASKSDSTPAAAKSDSSSAKPSTPPASGGSGGGSAKKTGSSSSSSSSAA